MFATGDQLLNRMPKPRRETQYPKSEENRMTKRGEFTERVRSRGGCGSRGYMYKREEMSKRLLQGKG